MILRLVLILLPIVGISTTAFDKSGFYAVFSKGDMRQINQELGHIDSASFPEKQAYTGALLMKRAGFRSFAGDKLSDFKSGAKKLEAAIASDSSNGEYRFLRLVIQENAPRIVGYRSDLDRDNLYIHSHFSELPPAVQQAVVDYSRHSRVLKPDNF